jgi:hypothetical protein
MIAWPEAYLKTIDQEGFDQKTEGPSLWRPFCCVCQGQLLAEGV